MTRRAKIPARIRRAVYIRDKWACRYCGRQFEPVDGKHAPHQRDPAARHPYCDDVWLELDHVLPHSRGGLDLVRNLKAACSKCNQRRGADHDSKWAERMATH